MYLTRQNNINLAEKLIFTVIWRQGEEEGRKRTSRETETEDGDWWEGSFQRGYFEKQLCIPVHSMDTFVSLFRFYVLYQPIEFFIMRRDLFQQRVPKFVAWFIDAIGFFWWFTSPESDIYTRGKSSRQHINFQTICALWRVDLSFLSYSAQWFVINILYYLQSALSASHMLRHKCIKCSFNCRQNMCKKDICDTKPNKINPTQQRDPVRQVTCEQNKNTNSMDSCDKQHCHLTRVIWNLLNISSLFSDMSNFIRPSSDFKVNFKK